MLDRTMTWLADTLGVLPKTDEERALRRIIELGLRVVGADEGSIVVPDEDTRTLRFVMTVGRPSAETALVGHAIPYGEGLTGLAALTGEVQVGAPTFMNPEQTDLREGSAPIAVIAAPMMLGERVIGVMTAVSFDVDKRFGVEDATTYAWSAAVAAVVVEQCARIRAVEGRPPAGVDGVHPRLLASVQRLLQLGPEAQASTAILLEAVADVVAPGQR